MTHQNSLVKAITKTVMEKYIPANHVGVSYNGAQNAIVLRSSCAASLARCLSTKAVVAALRQAADAVGATTINTELFDL